MKPFHMRGPSFRSWLAASLLLTAAAGAWALDVHRAPHSLQAQPSTFISVGTPASGLTPAGAPSTLQSRAPASTFAPVQAPATVFRAAEVPPERLQVTQQLLGELRARQTPERAIAIDLPADVLFDFDQSRLRPDARASLAKAAELLKSYPDAPLRIHGHTDGKGSERYNDALSQRRAQAVADALMPGGERRVRVEGFGQRRPVAPNAQPDGRDDPEGRQRNRRVEILIEPR
ncbi:MAG: OmpA family protein [Comamonadaceae bacterium]|nr:MAG: OmpA family protein [Comamonadaceae bacterium]